MDPTTLAAAAVKLLIPYLSKAAGALADKSAALAWEKLESLYAAVKEKFAGNTYAEETLKRVDEKPESPSRQAALAGVLEEEIRDDPGFAGKLQELLEEARESNVETIIQTVSVSGRARTGNITSVGKVEGNLDMGS